MASLASGAEVFGSDSGKVGDLKDVGEAEFAVYRGMKRDLRLPATSIGEVSGSDRVVLEVSADKADDFSESPISEGIWETLKGRE